MIIFPIPHRPFTPTPKVFGIGLSKTGNTSLCAALKALGFNAMRYPNQWRNFERHDAFTDATVAANFQELDRLFPDSRFILTVRDERSWLESCRAHFAERKTRALTRAVRLANYGAEEFNETLFRAAYRFHTLKVREHFSKRPEALLSLNICGQSKTAWKMLCTFLKRDQPTTVFPWENKTLQNENSPKKQSTESSKLANRRVACVRCNPSVSHPRIRQNRNNV